MRPEHKTVENFHSKFTPYFWMSISILTTGMGFSCMKLKISKKFNSSDCQKYNSASSYAKKKLNWFDNCWIKAISVLNSEQTKAANSANNNLQFWLFDFSWPVLLSNSFINSHATFQETEYGVNLEILKNNQYLFRSHSLLSLHFSRLRWWMLWMNNFLSLL